MKLYIKHMVGQKCKDKIHETLINLGMPYVCVDLGMIETQEDINLVQKNILKEKLQDLGFDLLDSKKHILMENIKSAVIQMVHQYGGQHKEKHSDYLSRNLGYDYTYMSNTFSQHKKMTLQQFIILHKVEKIKELLLYNELNLTEIAVKLNYSSVAHLSNQFKKNTGFSPSDYKKMNLKRKENLENL